MHAPLLLVVFLGLIIVLIGFTIGRIEKHRLERKQEHMEYLEQKQKEYLHRQRTELPELERQKQEYERLLSELDRSSLPTKEQMEKMHWYMNHFGYIDMHTRNQLNRFYNDNYPKNPFK